MMKSPSTKVVEMNLVDVPVAVEFLYHGPCKGYRENGIQMEPDDPPEAEIISIKHCGTDVTKHIMEADIEKLQESIIDEANE